MRQFFPIASEKTTLFTDGGGSGGVNALGEVLGLGPVTILGQRVEIATCEGSRRPSPALRTAQR